MQILIFGNSGSGKSTYANILAKKYNLAHLDLDSIVWVPQRIAVLREPKEIEKDLDEFLQKNLKWVIEGCYGELICRMLPNCSELVFMNPGKERCIQNNLSRPWEPNKYASSHEQNEMLPALINWVSDYYIRDDHWSYLYHRNIFENHTGPKRELISVPFA